MNKRIAFYGIAISNLGIIVMKKLKQKITLVISFFSLLLTSCDSLNLDNDKNNNQMSSTPSQIKNDDINFSNSLMLLCFYHWLDKYVHVFQSVKCSV